MTRFHLPDPGEPVDYTPPPRPKPQAPLTYDYIVEQGRLHAASQSSAARIEIEGVAYTPEDLSTRISQDSDTLVNQMQQGLIGRDEYARRYGEIAGRAQTLGEYVATQLSTYGIAPNVPKGVSIFDDEFWTALQDAPSEVQARFLFWQDPSNPEVNPWRLKKEMLDGDLGLNEDTGGGGHRSPWGVVKDMAGDSLGSVIKVLSWPSEQIEYHLFDIALRNAVDDDEARRIIARNGYRLSFSMLTDGSMVQDMLNAVATDSLNAEMHRASPAHGDDYPLTRAFSERTNWMGIAGDLLGHIALDPLWLAAPLKVVGGTGLYGSKLMKAGFSIGETGGILKGTKVGAETVADAERYHVLPRLGRFLAGGPASSAARATEMRLSADAFMAARGELKHSVGLLEFIGRRMPRGQAIETMQSVGMTLEQHYLNDASHTIDDVIGFFDDIGSAKTRTEAVEKALARGFTEASVNPNTARFAAYLKSSKKIKLLSDEVREGVELLTKSGLDERAGRLMLVDNIITAHEPEILAGLMGRMPKWYTKVLEPITAVQKRAMSVMQLGQPAFVALNFGYNSFIAAITLGNRLTPTRVVQSFRPFGRLAVDDGIARDIIKVGGSPTLHEAHVADQTFLKDIAGKVDYHTFDLEEAQKVADNISGQLPKGIDWSQKLNRAINLPVAIATKYADMPTRRLVYGAALSKALHYSEDFLDRGGLIDNLPKELLAAMPEWSTALLVDAFRDAPMTADGVRAAISVFEQRLLSDDGLQRISSTMLKKRFVSEVRGQSDPNAAKILEQDFDESARDLAAWTQTNPKGSLEEFLDHAGQVRDAHYTRANLIHELSKIAPIVPESGLEKARILNLEAAKLMTMDEVGHVERLVEASLGGTLSNIDRGRLMRRLSGHYTNDFSGADRIWRQLMEFELPADQVKGITAAVTKKATESGADVQIAVRGALSRARRTGRNKISRQFETHFKASQKSLDDLSDYVTGLFKVRDGISEGIAAEFFAARHAARDEHLNLIRGAQNASKEALTREDFARVWSDFGTQVSKLYEDLANAHGGIIRAGDEALTAAAEKTWLTGRMFGWGPNHPPYLQQMRSPVDRTTELMAFKAYQQDEFITWAGNLIRKDWDVLHAQKMPELPTLWREGLDKWGQKLGANRAEHAMAVKVAAYERASFSLTSYERQYGFDAILQLIAPFEFFPSRILWNWGRRTWDNPGAVSMLFKMARSSDQASEKVWKDQAREALMAYREGELTDDEIDQMVSKMKTPNKFRHMVPVPMPFLSQVPGIGQIIKGAGLSNLGDYGWIDPLAYFNPMEYYSREYVEDEAKKSTPLGRAVSWVSNNTPYGPSPLWTQLGSAAGILPERTAWTRTMFSGMPFGLPNTRAARGLASFLGTGNDLGELSEDDKTFLVNHDYLPETLLRKVIQLPPGDSWEQYLIDRTMSSLMFTGDIDKQLLTPDENATWQRVSKLSNRNEEEQAVYDELRSVRSARAMQSLKDRTGPAYTKARLEASRERGLRDVTGWVGIRVNPFLEGDLISRGLKILYDQSAASGTLSQFFERFPEYQIRDVASSDFNTGDQGRAAELDTTLYYYEKKRIEAPHKQSIDGMNDAQVWLEALEQTPDIQLALKDVKSQLSAVYDDISEQTKKLDEVYPLRRKTASLTVDPKVKAMRDLRTEYYGMELDTSIGDRSAQYDDLTARQDTFLSRLRPRTEQDTPLDWTDLRVSMLETIQTYKHKIDQAYASGKFSDIDKLKKERDDTLQAIHDVSAKRVTRQDFELFLNGGWKMPTPSQKEFDMAQGMFDQLMTLIGDNSPLSGREKSATVDAYLANPTFVKHFGDKFIDPTATQDWMLSDPEVQQYFQNCPTGSITACAIARRREIFDHYGLLDRGRPRVDYLRSIFDELNTVQRLLGLKPYKLYEPPPPRVQLPWTMPREENLPDLALSIARRGY